MRKLLVLLFILAACSHPEKEAGGIELLPPLSIPRAGQVLLDLGGELTVIGGHTTGFVPTATAEYLSGGKWLTVESIYPHDYALAARLPSGDVLVAGGMSEPFGKGGSIGAELYHPATHSFSPLPILDTARAVGAAASLPDGSIIVSGNWYGSDGIASYSQERGGERIKMASQSRAAPYILPSARDNALIFGGFDVRGEPCDAIVIDRVQGEPFTDSLFARWRPIRWEANHLQERYFIGNPALGSFASLIPVSRNEDGQVSIVKQVGEQFSLLETEDFIPMKGAAGDSIVWGSLHADIAAGLAYLVGTEVAKEHLYVCRIGYGEALQGGRAPVTLLTSDNPVQGWDLYNVLLPGGRIAFVGGNPGDNYNPLADAFILHTEPFQENRSLLLWPVLLLFGVIAAVSVWLLYRRTHKGAEPAPEFTDPANAKGPDLSSRIAALVEGRQLYLRKGLKVQDIATELGTNVTYISACINSQWGKTFPEYLGDLRVRHAQKQMLLHPDLPLHRIADEAGFSSEQSFYRSFKAVTGRTPSEWLRTQDLK